MLLPSHDLIIIIISIMLLMMLIYDTIIVVINIIIIGYIIWCGIQYQGGLCRLLLLCTSTGMRFPARCMWGARLA